MLINATKKVKSMHARRNPNLSVTSASYSQLSPSVTSATFLSPTIASRRGLLSPSPPPSPSLPSLIPRHGKQQPSINQSRLLKRTLIGFVGVAILVFIFVQHVYSHHPQTQQYENDGEEWEMVGDSLLPQEPSAVMVEDAKGRAKWTVSIPSSYGFPLRPQHYRDICRQSMELQKQVRQEAQASSNIAQRMLNYYQKDQYFMDVEEAEAQALLPPSKPSGRPKGFVNDDSTVGTTGLKVCDKSLTYVMETEDAGFGNTLLRLWMSYGLAMKENRAFFVDETRWPYGNYSTYFVPPPATGCMPPPTAHMVPCPHNARHIVVSGATLRHTFGHAFNEEYEDPTKMRVQRQHKIFGLLRIGYEALFKLAPEDAKYVRERIDSLYKPISSTGGVSIGIHVRHGDKHPFEYQYQKDYIPLDRYVDTARAMYTERVEGAGGEKHKKKNGDLKLAARHATSRLILASDDPDVYEAAEMGHTMRAQDHIILATKAALEAAQGKKNPWIDEITGWSGGFYRDVFFSLGQSTTNANDLSKLDNDVVPAGAMKLRELVGRAYLLDLAVLGRADTIVCTVSSIGCRILAVMMGWESAINQGNWKNVDGDFDWKGIMW